MLPRHITFSILLLLDSPPPPVSKWWHHPTPRPETQEPFLASSVSGIDDKNSCYALSLWQTWCQVLGYQTKQGLHFPPFHVSHWKAGSLNMFIYQVLYHLFPAYGFRFSGTFTAAWRQLALVPVTSHHHAPQPPSALPNIWFLLIFGSGPSLENL